MRVAFVTFSTVPFGSNDLLFYRAAEELIGRGHSVLVSPLDWGSENATQYSEIERCGASVFRRPMHTRSKSFFLRQWHKIEHQLSNKQKRWRFLKSFAPEIVVVSDAGTYHMMSAPGFCDFLRGSEIPYILISQFNDENSTLSEVDYRRARTLFGEARHCVFVSRRNLDVAKRQLCSDLQNGCVIDNPPSLPDLDLVPFLPSTTFSFAMVARLECAVKGQAIVIQALSSSVWKKRNWVLRIYGRGPDEAYLRDLIHFLGLEDKVFLCGFSNDIRSVWAENHLLIMGSSGEGKPLALTEAMLCGRPSVVTDVGGNAELVEDGVSGYVAESATVASLSKALERAWQQRELWPEIGQKAHQRVSALQTPAPANILSELIVNAVGNPSGPSTCTHATCISTMQSK